MNGLLWCVCLQNGLGYGYFAVSYAMSVLRGVFLLFGWFGLVVVVKDGLY